MTRIKRSVLIALALVSLNFSAYAQNDVTTALGITTDKEKLSYDVQSLDASDVNKVKQTNFTSSLIGKVAGAQINSSSVGAGGDTRIILRGTKSLSNYGNQVLYILDGMPLENFNLTDNSIGENAGTTQAAASISDLNADDIESIQVLTGPAATALYGANGANGAIIITTKKGTSKTTVRLSSTTTVGQATNLPDFQNIYGNAAGIYGSWGQKMLTPSSYNPADYLENTVTYDNTVSVSTGGKNSRSYFSVNHVDASGVYANSKYNKVGFKAKHSVDLFNDKITVDLGVNYTSQKDQNQRNQGTELNPLAEIYTYPVGEGVGEYGLYELYNYETGVTERNWAWGDQNLGLQNPYWKQNRMLTENSRKHYILDAAIKWNILDDLTLTARSRVDNTSIYNEQKYSAGTYFENGNENGYYELVEANNRSIFADAILKYNHTWDFLNLDVTAGVSLNDVSYSYTGFDGYLSSANAFNVSGIDASSFSINQISRASYQEKAAFASVNLGIKNYAYLTVSGRNDWASSLYNLGKTSFFSPSVGAAILPSEIFNMPSWVNLIKLRASTSKVGNTLNKYLLYNTYSNTADYEYYNSVTSYTLTNMEPETTKSNEVGFDLRLFNNMFNLSATYYKSKTSNQTYFLGLGADLADSYVRIGEVVNEGIELTVGLNYDINKNLNWKSNLTYSKNNNTITSLTAFNSDGTKSNSLVLGGYDGITYQITEGGSMSDIYIDNQLLTDASGGIVVNDLFEMQIDDRSSYYAGSLDPKYTLGFSNDFTWKNLNAGFLVNARVGGVCFSKTQLVLDAFGVSQASADLRDAGGASINYGTMTAESYYKAIYDAKIYGNYMYSATNVKLKELYVNYTFENAFKTDLDVTVGLTARDLWMIYCKAPFDPENVAVTGTYGYGVDYFMTPSTRNIAFNLILNF